MLRLQTGSSSLESEASTASFDLVVTKPAWVLISDHHLSDTKLCQWFRATYPDHTGVHSPDLFSHHPPESFLLNIPSFPAWLHAGAVSLLGLALNPSMAQGITPAAPTEKSLQLLLQTGKGKLSDSNPNSTDTLWVDENRNTGSLTCSKGL